MEGGNYLRGAAEQILERKKENKQPWITEEVLTVCDEKRKTRRIKNVIPTEENKEDYRRECREVE